MLFDSKQAMAVLLACQKFEKFFFFNFFYLFIQPMLKQATVSLFWIKLFRLVYAIIFLHQSFYCRPVLYGNNASNLQRFFYEKIFNTFKKFNWEVLYAENKNFGPKVDFFWRWKINFLRFKKFFLWLNIFLVQNLISLFIFMEISNIYWI